jgi:hypothetical protein
VLERVGVEVAGIERGVGKLVVVELDQLDLQAVAGGHFLHDFENLLRGADGYAYGDRGLVLRMRAGGECKGQRGGGKQAA